MSSLITIWRNCFGVPAERRSAESDYGLLTFFLIAFQTVRLNVIYCLDCRWHEALGHYLQAFPIQPVHTSTRNPRNSYNFRRPVLSNFHSQSRGESSVIHIRMSPNGSSRTTISSFSCLYYWDTQLVCDQFHRSWLAHTARSYFWHFGCTALMPRSRLQRLSITLAAPG